MVAVIRCGRCPGLVAIAVRWRTEIVAVGALWSLLHLLGGAASAIVGGLVLAAGIATPVARTAALRAWLFVVMPHRVRVALVHAGVTDRGGRLPWVLWAMPSHSVVRVEVALRAGTTPHDVERAAPVIATACGAAEVAVVQRPYRPDRITILVVRPRWGFP
jgi:hypothetical protein